ncbi:Gfo/Idh/MocA family protein [Paenibacillus oceani]|uniref:Gfo/Idh/MocA family oxidoreductase n=1 Tax=Paenibacillus oceani TaxID=2772510 RepID=A0A927C5Z9_9BACL|nr:Gfo/Idh/MocA family oxidoreductase [Paenibacillus oceani]MBD2861459.1 Gfo/Idh/MocA family oxidoreductase [Paenibacillus oceani]
MKIGIIGTDTSHACTFTKYLNDSNDPFHVPGGRVVAAYPGGSSDFPLSISRVAGYAEQLRNQYGVRLADRLESVAAECDAIMILSGDGRIHLEQFRKIVPYRKPVFIDKPLATTSADAAEMFGLAQQYDIPLMSSSAGRFGEALASALHKQEHGAIIGADVFGPMPIEPTQKGFFWYGIHAIEMLYTVMGGGCSEVNTQTTMNHDLIVGRWKDGRIGSARGNRAGNNKFGVVLHQAKGSQFVDVSAQSKPNQAAILTVILEMFQSGIVKHDPEITLEVIRFIEAANESRETGRSVEL